MNLTVSWSEIKTLVSTKGLYLQCYESPNLYNVWIQENGTCYSCALFKDEGEEVVDFETNYKGGCNKKIISPSIVTNGSNYFAAEGDTITSSSTVTDINVEDSWVEITSVTYDEGGFLVTDLSLSASKDGEWRICVGGYSLKNIFYRAKDFIIMTRNLPLYIPQGYKISLEYKTEVDAASASGCVGGIKNG